MSGAVRWGPAALVAAGAAVATAHGLFEVAVASKVPGGIAWLYPALTDGLALVAYSATRRLCGAGARYAWTVVVLSAALSGLAQAVYLAADSVTAAPLLRAGVGAWPAVACALVAHLLHLIVVAEREKPADEPGASVGTTDVRSTGLKTTEVSPASEQLPAPEPVASNQRASELAPCEPPASDPVTSTDTDQRVVGLARRLARGEDLGGAAIASELEVSPRTGRRLLADARAHLDQHQPLHLVTNRESSA